MRLDYRPFFPALAAFGPFFMVLGLNWGHGTTSGFVTADAGALMTSAALIMLFTDKTGATTPDSERQRRGPQLLKNLLFFCVLAVIGALIWLLTDRLFAFR